MENERIIKRAKFFDPIFLKNLDDIVLQEQTDLFIEQVLENGSRVMDPIHTNVLNLCMETGNIGMIKAFFDTVIEDSFDILFEVLRRASRSDPKMFKALARPKYISSEHQKYQVLEYFIKTKDMDSLMMMLKNGFNFKGWRSQRGDQTFCHLIVQKNWTKLISYVKSYDFSIKNKSGNPPIFYVSSVKMAKLIRFHFKGARDHLNKQGKTMWQIALETKSYDILNVLISPEKRLKKFRAKQVDFYNFPWVSSGTVLNISREKLLWDTLRGICINRHKWFQPKHRFFIKFIGETGLDCGGLKAEWMADLLKEMFTSRPDPNPATFTAPLFVKLDEDSDLYAPNTFNSAEVFRYAGSLIALSLAMNISLKVKFIPAIYRALMHEELDLEADLLEHSPDIYRNLQFLKLPTTNITEMEMSMPSNPSTHVTRRTLSKYIPEYSREVLHGRYDKQILSFVSGFESVLPVKITQYFTYEEFKKILTGKPADFTSQEFIAKCRCDCEVTKAALERVITEMTSVQRGLLLKFITGLNSLPVNGLAGLEKNFEVLIYRSLIGKLPTSATCAFALRVPPFVDYETFKNNLIRAIEWTNTTDNEPGVTNENDSIVLGIDDEVDDEAAIENGSESDVSKCSSSDNEEIEEDEVTEVTRSETNIIQTQQQQQPTNTTQLGYQAPLPFGLGSHMRTYGRRNNRRRYIFGGAIHNL